MALYVDVEEGEPPVDDLAAAPSWAICPTGWNIKAMSFLGRCSSFLFSDMLLLRESKCRRAVRKLFVLLRSRETLVKLSGDRSLCLTHLSCPCTGHAPLSL